jgi:hypothetical protein
MTSPRPGEGYGRRAGLAGLALAGLGLLRAGLAGLALAGLGLLLAGPAGPATSGTGDVLARLGGILTNSTPPSPRAAARSRFITSKSALRRYRI